MLSTSGPTRRFNLLYLEEGEHYITAFNCQFRYFDTDLNKHNRASGCIHFCSRSLLIEPDESTKPIYKYLYKFISQGPSYNPFNKDDQYPIKLAVSRLIEVPCQVKPKPYKQHQFLETDVEKEYMLQINIRYDQADPFFQALNELVTINKKKKTFSYEMDQEQLLSDMTHRLSSSSTKVSPTKSEIKFNKTRIKKMSEKSLFNKEFPVKRILPLVEISGLLYITNERIYFQPYHNIYDTQVISFSIKRFQDFFKRRFKLIDIGLQLVLQKNNDTPKTLYLAFDNVNDRNAIYDAVSAYLPGSCKTENTPILEYTKLWSDGKLSNYDYLQICNTYAQRSTQDLTQYPVFPWVIKEFKSEVLDLKDRSVFRDLSLPIGAMNEKRLKDFKSRYYELPEDERYLYGTHYSCPGYVIGFLVRSNPQWMIKFQGGKFDNPNRLFKGIYKEWDSCQTNPGNVKELIPEFFESQTDFLKNDYNLDLGVRSNGKRVDHVKLPTWARTPEDYLKKQREALESDYVSQNINKWIDLIFGIKQCSIQDNNVFHPVTYQGKVDVNILKDPMQRLAFETQISEFGQTPKQIFFEPHPQKYSEVITNQKQQPSQLQMQITSPVQSNKYEDDSPVKQSDDPVLSRFKDIHKFCIQKLSQAHQSEITCVIVRQDSSGTKFITTGLDGFIKLNDLEPQSLKCHFVNQQGISTACQMGSPDVFALATLNNNINLFNFFTGSTIQKWYAHDEQITSVLFRDNVLITCSLDQLMKFWDVNLVQIKEPIFVMYEHEEAIYSADLHPTEDLMASVDAEGNVIFREIKNPNNLIAQFRPQDELSDPIDPEKALLMFNVLKKDEFFVSVNNILFTYRFKDQDFKLYKNLVFNANIVSMTQDTDTLLVSLDNDSLVVYDWQTCKVNHEWTDFAPQICQMQVKDSMLLCGTRDGDVLVFKEEKVE